MNTTGEGSVWALLGGYVGEWSKRGASEVGMSLELWKESFRGRIAHPFLFLFLLN